MIVVCEHCSTRFQLDDARIPAGGVRVRCSRCKHAFFLALPGASEEEAIHGIAEEAAATEEPRAPEPAHDLAEPGGFGDLSDAGEDEEEDWEFNQEIPGAAATHEGAPESVGDEPELADSPFDGSDAPGLSDEYEDEGEVPDLDDGEPDAFGADDLEVDGFGVAAGAEEVGSDAGPVELAQDDFGASEDFSSLAEDEPPQVELSADPDPAASAEAQALPDTAESELAEETPDELGDPESWNLFDDDGPDSLLQPGAVPAPVRSDLGALADALAADGAEESFGDSASVPGLEGYVPDLSNPRRGHGWLSSGINGVGWAVVIALVAAGVGRGLLPPLETGANPPPKLAIQGLRAIDPRSVWVDTASAGPLLAVRGELTGLPGASEPSRTQLQAKLLDRDGRPLDVAPVPVGTPLHPRVLRELPIEKLRQQQRLAAANLRAAAIAPGQRLAFEVVFTDVPLEAASVQLEGRALASDAIPPKPDRSLAPSELSTAPPDPTDAG